MRDELFPLMADLCSRRKKPTRILAGAAIYDAVCEQARKGDEFKKWMRWSDPDHSLSLTFMGLPLVLCEMMEPDAWLMDTSL